MKNFVEYLTEAQKTYKFKVRVAGDLPEGFADRLESALSKYDIVGISAGKKTPISEKPLDFPQLQNIEVTHYDVEVNYPATAFILEQYLSVETGVGHSHIIVRGEHDPIERYQENTGEEKPYESLLNQEDLGGESAQDSVSTNRVMELLKELETARKERDIDPVEGIEPGKSKDISNEENAKSPIGS